MKMERRSFLSVVLGGGVAGLVQPLGLIETRPAGNCHSATELPCPDGPCALDNLTGLKNHRLFNEELKQRIMIAERSERPLSLLLIDVDHLQLVNDVWGHAAGDKVLQGVARIARDGCRNLGLPFRNGGGELAVICPDTDTTGALELAERIRESVETNSFGTGAVSFKTTVSVGVASVASRAATGWALVDLAQQALFSAKEEGRNRSRIGMPEAR